MVVNAVQLLTPFSSDLAPIWSVVRVTESGLIRSVEDDWGLSLAIDIVRKLTLLALCLTYFWEMDRNGPKVRGNQSVAAQKF